MLIPRSNGPHTSRGLARHTTVFVFNQVARHEYGQSWGAHIFEDGAIHAFFDTKRVLFDDELIPTSCKFFFLCSLEYYLNTYYLVVFYGFIAHTVEFTSNTIRYFQ